MKHANHGLCKDDLCGLLKRYVLQDVFQCSNLAKCNKSIHIQYNTGSTIVMKQYITSLTANFCCVRCVTISPYNHHLWTSIFYICITLAMANFPNRYSALCSRPVMHAQTWASYSALYQFGRLSLAFFKTTFGSKSGHFHWPNTLLFSQFYVTMLIQSG